MSFLNRLFNKPKKSEENNMDEIVSNTTSTSNTDKPLAKMEHPKPTLHSPHLYEFPTYPDIRNNISVHQTSLLLLYHDLAYVASSAYDSIVLGAPVKHSTHPGKKLDEYNRIYEENSEFARANFKKNIKLSKKLDGHLFTRSQLFTNARDIYPDFGQNMRKKVSPENYDLYHQVVVSFKKSLYLTSKDDTSEILSETLATAQSKIAEVVKTSNFARACEIEDKFILSEIDRFFLELSKAPTEDQLRVRKSTIEQEDGTKIGTIEFINRIREERISRLQKYSDIQNLDGKPSVGVSPEVQEH